MIYLISAYSVNPYNGSEDGVGWNWVLQYEKNYRPGDRIILLTKKYNEASVLKGIEEYKIKHIELVICDVPRYLNWFREKYSIFHHMYYILWQHWAWRWVKASKIHFDVIHHVTMGDYRIIGEMYKAKHSKTIFGPIGGAQITPKNLKCYEKNKIIADFRTAINSLCSINPFYIKGMRSFTEVFPSNRETYEQICSIRGKKHTKQLVEIGVSSEYRNLNIEKKENNRKIKILFAGRLIEKKGIIFLLQVAQELSNKLDFELRICGSGTLEDTVRKTVTEYCLEDKVTICKNKKHSEMITEYINSDIFVLPSLRETGGTVLIEAMACKLPIVGFDTSFCSQLKENKCGLFVETNQSLEGIKKDYCEYIKRLANCVEMRAAMGEAGYKFVNKELTWDRKYSIIHSRINSN